MKLLKILFIIYMFFCSACVPFPHFFTQVPDVSGTVTFNGVPLRGVSVLITHELNDESCSMPSRSSVTDTSGHFKLKRVRKFGFFATMGDHIYRIKLCIIKDGNRYVGYTDGGIGYPPDSMKLRCIINSDSKFADKNTPDADIDKLAVCTIDK